MAKKKARRVPRTSTPRLYGGTPPAQAGTKPAGSAAQPAATAAPATARASTANARTVAGVARPNVPLAVQYRYVAADLRRLGITAASFFALLIVAGVVVYFLQR